MPDDTLCPRDKHDLERVALLVAAGPEAAKPILAELLGWLQDMNWPVAPPLADFLVTVGEPLLPHLRQVLSSGDDMWIYGVLQHVVAHLPAALIRELAGSLHHLASAAENDIVALRILAQVGGLPQPLWHHLLDHKIEAYAAYLVELRALRAEITPPPSQGDGVR